MNELQDKLMTVRLREAQAQAELREVKLKAVQLESQVGHFWPFVAREYSGAYPSGLSLQINLAHDLDGALRVSEQAKCTKKSDGCTLGWFLLYLCIEEAEHKLQGNTGSC